MKTRHLVTAGVLTYLVMLFLTLPAAMVIDAVQAENDSPVLSGVNGTVFSGRASQVRLHGIELGPLVWQIRASRLLLGRLEYQLVFSGERFPGHAIAGISVSGNKYARDLAMSLDQDFLINQWSPMEVQTGGRLIVAVEDMEFDGAFPSALTGFVQWSDAELIEPLQLALGRVELIATSDAENLTGSVTNNGSTAVSGEISLSRNGNYTLDLYIKPAAGASEDLAEILEMAGQLQSDGSYHLSDAGSI